jgi:hypothetical protein
MIWFTWVCYISYNKGEEGIGHYVIRVGTIPPPTVYGYTTPSLPRIPPTYSDILTCFGGDNPLNEIRTPISQKKFWKKSPKIGSPP